MREITFKLPEFLFDGHFWLGVGGTALATFLIFRFVLGKLLETFIEPIIKALWK
jgi:hypothetical protein